MAAENGNVVGTFTIYLDDKGASPESKDAKVSVPTTPPSLDTATETSRSDSQTSASSDSATAMSDEDILRGIRYVETATGRKSGGAIGGYSDKIDKIGVYGAYQIMKSVWQPSIKSKFGWSFEDWYNVDPNADNAELLKARQDKIAKDLILPEYKREVKQNNLYGTPLGRHLPQGSLEMLAQLGVGNLREFLTTGYDKTAYDNKQSGQIMGYLQSAMKLFNKRVPDSFYEELARMGGLKTKYSKTK